MPEKRERARQIRCKIIKMHAVSQDRHTNRPTSRATRAVWFAQGRRSMSAQSLEVAV
jgi:hypothetical protein